MNSKRYKVMADVLSTGIWDGFGCVALEEVLGHRAADLEAELAAWHAGYDDQFKRYPYAFDWDAFNEHGRQLAERIKALAPADVEVYYEPSDDREFFTPADSNAMDHTCCSPRNCELVLRERKRTLLHVGFSSEARNHLIP